MKTLYAKSAETTAPSVTKYGRRSITELGSPFEWVPEQLSRFLTDPTIATLLEHPGQ